MLGYIQIYKSFSFGVYVICIKGIVFSFYPNEDWINIAVQFNMFIIV